MLTGDAYLDDPFTATARLRKEGAVHRVTGPDGSPAWLVTGYPEVRDALADSRLALSRRHANDSYRGSGVPEALDRHLLNLDAPDHTRLRRLVTVAFTAHRVAALRDRIAATAHRLLESVADDDADLIGSYAAPLPMALIGELLGVPPDDRVRFHRWTTILVNAEPDRSSRLPDALDSMRRLTTTLIRRKRGVPGDDLISELLHRRDTDEVLAEDELLSLVFLLLGAGYETSVNLIGSCLLHVLLDPRRRAELSAQPARLAPFVEEVVRLEAPATLATRRFPLHDIEIGGTVILAGETVFGSIASANRDPRRFVSPDVLDPRRDSNPHLGFGHGPHYCLGAPLARLSAEVAVSTLLRPFPHVTLAVGIDRLSWRRSARARGLLRLPVHLHRRGR